MVSLVKSNPNDIPIFEAQVSIVRCIEKNADSIPAKSPVDSSWRFPSRIGFAATWENSFPPKSGSEREPTWLLSCEAMAERVASVFSSRPLRANDPICWLNFDLALSLMPGTRSSCKIAGDGRVASAINKISANSGMADPMAAMLALGAA